MSTGRGLKGRRRGETRCKCCGFEKLNPSNPNIILSGKGFSLFKDYVVSDIDELQSLNYEDRVKYLKARSELVFLEPLDEILRHAESKYLVRFHEMDIITILCCGIEALGHYLTGKGKYFSEASFKKFVREFMPNWEPASEELWGDFRNGLSHGSYTKHGGIEKGLGKPFKSDGDKGIKAFDNFFKKLELEKETFEENFTARFNEVLIN